MNGRAPFSDELLSAYLDGEVSAEERAEVERLLEEREEHRRMLDGLRSLDDQLRLLPEYRLNDRVSQRICDEIAGAAQAYRAETQVTESDGELISAYMDGELSDDEQRRAVVLLESSPECRQLLADLQKMQADLCAMPSHQLDDGVSQRICDEVERLAQAPETEAQDAELDDELISAYMDGELSGDEQRRAEVLLENSSECRQLLAELQEMQADLRALPSHKLDDGFADRVMRQAERHMLLVQPSDEDAVAEQVELADKPESDAGRSTWRSFVWATVAVAAAVLLVAELGIFTPLDDRPDLVKSGVEQVDPETPVVPPHVVPPEREVPQTPESQGSIPSELVGRESKQHLVLVYELSVTPEGVDKAAFGNLLKRHGIRFHQTVAVDPKRQKSLLKHRFLKNVQMVGDDREDMDTVELFLVSCTGRVADGMFQDLVNRPTGVASFFLNLTTREAEDRILHRLANDSGVSDESGQAIQLAVNFAILSRTARNLGAFGTIRWIEPSLLDPTLAPPPADAEPEKPGSGAAQEAPTPEALAAGDFPCELLLVVRNLKPLEDGDDAEE